MVCEVAGYGVPAVIRFRLPSWIQSVDFRRRNQLGDYGVVAGFERGGDEGFHQVSPGSLFVGSRSGVGEGGQVDARGGLMHAADSCLGT